MPSEEKFDWNRVIAFCNVGLLVCAAIPVAFLVWDRTHPPGQPIATPEASMNTSWVFPAVIGAMFLGIALSIVASVINRHQPKSPQNNPQGVDPDVYNETLNDLNKCESDLKHWKGEAAREQNFRKEQVEIRDKRIGEYGGTIANLEQQLRIAQDKLEGFSTPRGRLKIKSGLYHALGKSGLDVTETLDQIILDDQLVLNVRYNDLFFPDPWPGVRKHLTIEFYHGPREFSVIVPENTKLTLPFPYSDLV